MKAFPQHRWTEANALFRSNEQKGAKRALALPPEQIAAARERILAFAKANRGFSLAEFYADPGTNGDIHYAAAKAALKELKTEGKLHLAP